MEIGTRVCDFVTRNEATIVEVSADAVRLEWDLARGQETFWYTLNYFTAPDGAHPMIEVLES